MGYDTSHKAWSGMATNVCGGYLELWVQMPRLNGSVYNYYSDWKTTPPWVLDNPGKPNEPYSDVYAVSGRHRISISGPDVSSPMSTFKAHAH
jgi:hypothetical protein